MQELFALHQPNGPERCGVIYKDGSIIEVDNIHPDPNHYFAMPLALVDSDLVEATWHTHPRTSGNLSVADYKSFVSLPKLRHYIVAETEIWCYGMSGDILAVYQILPREPVSAHHDHDYLTRPSEGSLLPGN